MLSTEKTPLPSQKKRCFAEISEMKTIRNTNSPPWNDGEVRHLIRKKNAALQRFRQNKTAERKLKLRIISQNIKCSVRRKHHYLAKKTLLCRDFVRTKQQSVSWNYVL